MIYFIARAKVTIYSSRLPSRSAHRGRRRNRTLEDLLQLVKSVKGEQSPYDFDAPRRQILCFMVSPAVFVERLFIVQMIFLTDRRRIGIIDSKNNINHKLGLYDYHWSVTYSAQLISSASSTLLAYSVALSSSFSFFISSSIVAVRFGNRLRNPRRTVWQSSSKRCFFLFDFLLSSPASQPRIHRSALPLSKAFIMT